MDETDSICLFFALSAADAHRLCGAFSEIGAECRCHGAHRPGGPGGGDGFGDPGGVECIHGTGRGG